jgi:hypothetical protein
MSDLIRKPRDGKRLTAGAIEMERDALWWVRPRIGQLRLHLARRQRFAHPNTGRMAFGRERQQDDSNQNCRHATSCEPFSHAR